MNIKRLLAVLFVVGLLPLAGFGQTTGVVDNVPIVSPSAYHISIPSMQGVGKSQWYRVNQYGVYEHELNCSLSGTLSVLSINLEGSNDQTDAGATVIGSSTDTTGCHVTGSGNYSYVRVNITASTGTGRVFPAWTGTTANGTGGGGGGGGGGDVNITQINGNTVNRGLGAAGTGTIRVATASDSSIATVGAVTAITNALPAGTNVIGHVITDLGSVAAITGAKGNNTAIPSTTNLGTLPCVATTAAPTYTNTYQVACSTDLAGAMRVSVVSGSAGNGAASPTASAVPSDADYQGINVGGTLRGQTGTNTSGSIYAADVNIAAAPAMVYNATQPTKTDGQTFPDFQLTNRGELKVAPGVSGFAVTSTSSITDCATETTVCSAPVPIGAVYYSSPTALTNGQVAYPLLDTDHRLTTNIGKINGVTPLMGAGNTGTGSLRVTVASDQVTIPVTILPAATSGWSSINATAADSGVPCTSTPEPIKASQGVFGGYFITNPNTADMWVHIYNVAYGSVTVGTTVPQLSFRIPGNSTESRAANLEISQGIQFSAAMSYACTTSAAANGNPSTALEADFFYR